MAVRKTREENGEADFTVDNGDLIALNRIKEQYGLADGDDVIVFAIGVLAQAGGRPVTVELPDGTRKKLLPSQQLKGQQEDGRNS